MNGEESTCGVTAAPAPDEMQQAKRAGFMFGWKAAAVWANRDDLIADISSPAYERDCDAACGVRVPSSPLHRHTYCSQCGTDLGPGDEGVSSCCDHGCCQVEARGDTCECGRTPAEKGKR